MKFIFPVQLIACNPLIELLDFQRTDLTKPDGLQHLVEAILDDWRRRPSGPALSTCALILLNCYLI
jgi:hypothetical protein